MSHVYILNTLFLLLCLSPFTVFSLIVDAPFGKIRGKHVPGGSNNQGSVIFSNIPFTKPPVGELRFAKPQPHPKIDDVFDATDDQVTLCMQPDMATLPENSKISEDCLILNIHVPGDGSANKLKKVIVFIHGGGFIFGTSGIYDMSSFVMSQDVIGVTVNYRLGVLGFLSTGNDANPGNFGMWDQVLALQWIKDNIKAFGGDPDDVTISGQSAGGASVGHLLLSPVTKGLFSKAIPQSGSASSVFATAKFPLKQALIIGKSQDVLGKKFLT